MKYILTYQNFNESKGISNSCEEVLNEIWIDIESNVSSMISNKKVFNIDKDDFKVKNIIVEYKIEKGNDRFCKAASNLKTSYLKNGHLNDVSISLNIKITDEIDDEFIYYIKSVLFHELLHIFQHYNILLNKKFRPESFSIGSILPELRKLVKTKYAEYILDILYYSLSHEISAQLHQYYLYKTNHKNYDKLNDIKKLLSSFMIKNDLNEEESEELNLIKQHILGSIKFYTTNKEYKKNISKSLWNENDNNIFLNKLFDLVKVRIKWIDKKLKLIDSKFNKPITYHETISLPSNWDDHDLNDRWEYYNFIKENLNDCKIIDGI